MVKKYFTIIFGTTVAFALGIFIFASAGAQVGFNSNIIDPWGWGGSGNINPSSLNTSSVGWISFSGSNVGTSGSYEVSFPQNPGSVTGYAWSSNLGWIQFDPAGPYPQAGGSPVRRVTDTSTHDKLTGFARILSIQTALEDPNFAGVGGNSGGWEGWISMETPGVHKVQIEKATGDLSGYAWSPELGWIAFYGNIDAAPTTSLPQLSITAPDSLANENGTPPGTGRFRISRSNTTVGDLTVTYTINGTALYNLDYTSNPNLGGTIVIPDGASSIDILIDPINDTLNEGNETISLTIEPNPSYTIANALAIITIIDDDMAGNIPNVSCSGYPNPAILSNGSVTVSWRAIGSGGTPPYTYIWTSFGNSTQNPINVTYNSIGIKTADVTIQDSEGEKNDTVCTIQVETDEFEFEEILPFL